MDDFNVSRRSKVEQYPGHDDHKFTGLHDNFFKAIPNVLNLPGKKYTSGFHIFIGWRNLKCKNRGQWVTQSSLGGRLILPQKVDLPEWWSAWDFTSLSKSREIVKFLHCVFTTMTKKNALKNSMPNDQNFIPDHMSLDSISQVIGR
jgi:hypothetical protein